MDIPQTRTHPFLTLLGVISLIGIAWWVISSLGVKKGKKAPKSIKKGQTTNGVTGQNIYIPPAPGNGKGY